METTNKKTVSRSLFFGMFALLTLTCGILVYEYQSVKTQSKQFFDQNNTFQGQLLSLSDSLESKKNELNLFKGKNADLDKLVADKQTEIDIQKQKIRSLILSGKATNKELNEARLLVTQYENVLADLNAQITKLHEQNDQLMAENSTLSNELLTEKELTASLNNTNNTLSKKVEIASLLPVANIELNAVKKRNNGKDMKVRKAKNTEALKISFDTGENQVLDAGNVSVYVRIINPKGETIAVNDMGSGLLSESQSGTPILYTQKANIDWQNTNKKVTLYWGENVSSPGVYKVELLQNGYLIGKSEIKLS
jgi:hypothetical protein